MPNLESYNERRLLQLISEGDEAAFRQLYDIYSNRLFLFTLRLTRSKEQAEDTLQDTFLKIWARRQTLPAITDFSAYLFRMAQNGVINAVQQSALETSILQNKMTAAVPESLPDEQLQASELKEVWQQAIRQLTPQQQKVYVLRKEYGWKISSIADALSLSPRTVKRHLADAQQTVRISMTIRFPDKELMIILFLGALHYC